MTSLAIILLCILCGIAVEVKKYFTEGDKK